MFPGAAEFRDLLNTVINMPNVRVQQLMAEKTGFPSCSAVKSWPQPQKLGKLSL